ncbi:DoxX family protein [Pseudobacteriovorax antillogorgiicola]|uniref:Putative oxidoreductase n=1 Tax=Pseudobacteriovorax antillogorgiicola TaxID=1513793 RepID=A0A1Y6C2Q5_9BACT|nr:DoxX family protein [Pseudobacteriovorax antillogorgiicola]TCS52296.1 putative oxidoreductase [Pseudobacteriovorax antillogorgiicola]SMF30482.1 putative oxidoreductase [Pseudobacteriovorax antillogorgiicola]
MSLIKTYNHHVGLLILRVSLGLTMLLAHGLPKIDAFPGLKFPDPIGLGSQLSWGAAVAAEVGCSILLVLGLWTRLSLAPLIFTMLIAVFVVHSGDPFAKKELGLMYMIGYIALFIAGPGKHSVDWKIQGR